MKVLVTGGTGFVGSHTVRALLAAGHSVRLLARSRAKVDAVFGAEPRQVDDVLLGDVADADCVPPALQGCDAVVHAAAVVTLQARRAAEVEATNLRGVENVVGQAWQRGVPRILWISSVGAIFRPGGVLTADAPIAEPREAYANSKARGERYVRGLQEEGAPIHTTYPSGVVGPDDPGLSETNHGLATFVNTCMVVTSTGFQMVDVRDVAEAHLQLLESEPRSGRWAIGGHYYPWPAMVELMDQVCGAPVRRFRIPGTLLRGLGHIGDVIKRVHPFDFPLTRESMLFATQWPGMDDAKTRETLGIRYRDPRDTIADALRWMHRQGLVEARRIPALVS